MQRQRQPPRPKDYDRGDQLKKIVGAVLEAQGFRRSRSRSWWVKQLDCGLFMVIENELHERASGVRINVVPAAEKDHPHLVRSIFVNSEGDQAERLPRWIGRMNQKAEDINRVRCPHCGGLMAEREVKKEDDPHFGETFLGCVRYPDCRGMRAEWKTTMADDEGKAAQGVHCPDCGSPLMVRYAKQGAHQGNRFYGCGSFPKCKKIVSEEEVMAMRMMGDEEP